MTYTLTECIWRGPEYFPEIITMDKVIFYRFRHFRLWDHVPESLVCTPKGLTARFVSTALAAFQTIIGNGKKERQRGFETLNADMDGGKERRYGMF